MLILEIREKLEKKKDDLYWHKNILLHNNKLLIYIVSDYI